MDVLDPGHDIADAGLVNPAHQQSVSIIAARAV
jgi:hypothetical protein